MFSIALKMKKIMPSVWKFFLVNLIISHSLSFNQFYEITSGMEIMQVLPTNSLIAVKVRNPTTLSSQLQFFNPLTNTFGTIGSVPSNLFVQSYKYNTVQTNYFIITDNFNSYTIYSQNLTNSQTINVNANFIITFDETDQYVYYLKLTGAVPSFMYQIFSIQSFVGVGPSAVLGAIYPSIPTTFESHRDKLYLCYIDPASLTLNMQIFYSNSFSSPDQSFSIYTTANSSTTKFLEDLMFIHMDTVIAVYNVSNNHTTTDWIQIGVGPLAGMTGLIVDFFISSSTLVFKTDSQILYKYDLITKTVTGIGNTTAPGERINYFNTTHFVIWTQGATSFFVTPLETQLQVSNYSVIYDPLHAAQFFRQIWPKQKSEVLGVVLIASCLKSIFKLIMPFIIFVEEFWLYKYHRVDYPELMKAFMEEIDIINMMKISFPFSLQFPSNYFEWAGKVNQKYLNSTISSQPTDPSQIFYFMEFPVLVLNILTNVCLFTAMWILIIVIFQIGKKCPKFLILKSALEKRSRFPVLFINIMQSNLTVLAFYLPLQVFHLYFFQQTGKWALLATILLLWLVIMYAFVGYFLVHFLSPISVRNSIVLAKPRYKGYVIEIILMVAVKLLKGFVHSLLIQFYLGQIITLWSIDLIIIIAIFCFRNEFINKLFFISSFAYYVFLFLINFTLFSRYFWFTEQNQWRETSEIMIIIFLLLLLVVTLIRMLLCLFNDLKEFLICPTKKADQMAIKEIKGEQQLFKGEIFIPVIKSEQTQTTYRYKYDEMKIEEVVLEEDLIIVRGRVTKVKKSRFHSKDSLQKKLQNDLALKEESKDKKCKDFGTIFQQAQETDNEEQLRKKSVL